MIRYRRYKGTTDFSMRRVARTIVLCVYVCMCVFVVTSEHFFYHAENRLAGL